MESDAIATSRSFETALAELIYIGTWTASPRATRATARNSAHPSIVPFQNFRTSDGWVVIGAAKPKFWALLCDVIGMPELHDDPRFSDFAARDANRDGLLAILEPVFAGRTSAAWVDALSAAGIPCGVVNDVAGALEDPQTIARGMVHEYEHPQLGTVGGSDPHFGSTPTYPPRPAARFAASTPRTSSGRCAVTTATGCVSSPRTACWAAGRCRGACVNASSTNETRE